MKEEGQTLFDKLIYQIKNNKYLSIILLLGVTVIAFASFTDAFSKLYDIIFPPPPPPVIPSVKIVSIKSDENKLEKGKQTVTFIMKNNSNDPIIIRGIRLKVLNIEMTQDKNNIKNKAVVQTSHIYSCKETHSDIRSLRKINDTIDIPFGDKPMELPPHKPENFKIELCMRIDEGSHCTLQVNTEIDTDEGLFNGGELTITING